MVVDVEIAFLQKIVQNDLGEYFSFCGLLSSFNLFQCYIRWKIAAGCSYSGIDFKFHWQFSISLSQKLIKFRIEHFQLIRLTILHFQLQYYFHRTGQSKEITHLVDIYLILEIFPYTKHLITSTRDVCSLPFMIYLVLQILT